MTKNYFEVKFIVECKEKEGDSTSNESRLKRLITETFLYLPKYFPSFKIISLNELSFDEYKQKTMKEGEY